MKTACIPINLQRCESPVWIVSTSYIFLLCSMITCTICPIVDYEPKAPCCVRNSPSPARNRHAVENSESTAGGSALAIKILWTDPCITDIYIYIYICCKFLMFIHCLFLSICVLCTSWFALFFAIRQKVQPAISPKGSAPSPPGNTFTSKTIFRISRGSRQTILVCKGTWSSNKPFTTSM